MAEVKGNKLQLRAVELLSTRTVLAGGRTQGSQPRSGSICHTHFLFYIQIVGVTLGSLSLHGQCCKQEVGGDCHAVY